MAHIEEDIKAAEKELDDDAESIITNERYVYIAEIIKACYKKKNAGQLSASDKIDRIVTNRWLGLPIFAAGHVPGVLHLHGHRWLRRYRLGERRPVRRRLAPAGHRLRLSTTRSARRANASTPSLVRGRLRGG